MCPLRINILALNTLISKSDVSKFKLAIEVCFRNYFELIHDVVLSQGSTKSVYLFGTPDTWLTISLCSPLTKGAYLVRTGFHWLG